MTLRLWDYVEVGEALWIRVPDQSDGSRQAAACSLLESWCSLPDLPDGPVPWQAAAFVAQHMSASWSRVDATGPERQFFTVPRSVLIDAEDRLWQVAVMFDNGGETSSCTT